MLSNGAAKKKLKLKVSLEDSWREEQRKQRERDATLIAQRRQQESIAQRRHRQEVLRPAQTAYRKLAYIKQRGPDAREAVDQILRVITLRRQVMRTTANPFVEFESYRRWDDDISAVNNGLGGTTKVTHAEILSLFLQWPHIQKRYAKKNPSFFTLEKQIFPTAPEAVQNRYRVIINKHGPGPTFSVQLPGGKKTAKAPLPKKPTPQKTKRGMYQGDDVRTRNEKKRDKRRR